MPIIAVSIVLFFLLLSLICLRLRATETRTGAEEYGQVADLLGADPRDVEIAHMILQSCGIDRPYLWQVVEVVRLHHRYPLSDPFPRPEAEVQPPASAEATL